MALRKKKNIALKYYFIILEKLTKTAVLWKTNKKVPDFK